MIDCLERYGELIDWAMIILNPLEPWPGELVLDAAQAADVALIARVVDYGGLFHDDVLPGHAFAEHDHRMFRPAGWIEAGCERLEQLRPIADAHEMSMLQLACAWDLAQSTVRCVAPTLIQEPAASGGQSPRAIEDKRAELAAVPEEIARSPLSPEEVRQIREIGENTGCMALKGATPRTRDRRARIVGDSTVTCGPSPGAGASTPRATWLTRPRTVLALAGSGSLELPGSGRARVVDVERRGQRLQLIDDVPAQAHRREPIQGCAALREDRDRPAGLEGDERQRAHRLHLKRGADAEDQIRGGTQLARALHRFFGERLAEQHDFRAQRPAAGFAAGDAVRIAEAPRAHLQLRDAAAAVRAGAARDRAVHLDQLRVPASRCSMSTFWVITPSSMPLRSIATSAWWASLGRLPPSVAKRSP